MVKKHNLVGPAVLTIINGKIINKMWYENGMLHRNYKNGPAFIKYIYTHNERYILEKNYFKRGKYHRLNGPATIRFAKHSNKVIHFCYYINGLYYNDKEYFNEALFKYKLKALNKIE